VRLRRNRMERLCVCPRCDMASGRRVGMRAADCLTCCRTCSRTRCLTCARGVPALAIRRRCAASRECLRLGCGHHSRPAMGHCRQLRSICARGVPELVLRSRRRIVAATSCRKLRSGWPSRRTAPAAIEADPIHAAAAGDSAAVHVVNNRAIDVTDGAVVVKRTMIPIPAVVAETRIPEPVVDSSIESNRQAPISFVP
jgi:hypothetical protein